MDQITIRFRNPNDITLDEAGELAQAIRMFLPEHAVQVEGKE
jgi:hypothetical protein